MYPAKNDNTRAASFQINELQQDKHFHKCLAIIRRCASITLDAQTAQRVANSHAFVSHEIQAGRQIYGITSGFGPLVNINVDHQAAKTHQKNLIYHLATGTGAPFDPETTRAIMLIRLITLSQGHSGISLGVVQQLVAALNNGFTPYIPQRGTVGASGDLTPLAHLALALMGEGSCLLGNARQLADVGLRHAKIQAVQFDRRDALALVNGTAAMTGVALMNGAKAGGLIDHSIKLAALHAEVILGWREAWHPHLSALRGHNGQQHVASRLWQLTEDTQLMKPCQPLYKDDAALAQDPYSTRCAPQVIGAVVDQWHYHQHTVHTEFFGIDDNPVADIEENLLLHGGNFFGQSIGFVSDALAQACLTLAILAERRIARLVDPHRNNGLPAFLQATSLGLNSGFMGAQVSASALVAEMRSLIMPAAIQSIPTNNNNQDIVPMGTIAARNCTRIIDLCQYVLAIDALCCAQAAELRSLDNVSTSGKTLVQNVRQISPFLAEDRPLHSDIEQLTDLYRQHLVTVMF